MATKRDGDTSDKSADRYTVLSVKTIVLWAVLILAVGVGAAVWLLQTFTGGDEQANRNQLDAVRTAGTIVVGTGGAAALLLAARRQRATEIALRQQERATDITDHDATQRRVTELYTKAVEQLGSDKAPVRLGGLYALERLAQDHVEQRQTIVNVLCAYLRMPYTLPGDPPDPDTIPDVDVRKELVAEHRERTQEREVRLAAQRILAHHLRPGNPDNPVDTFWKNIDLDLTGATLIDLDLDACAIRTGNFRQARFCGYAAFNASTFSAEAAFLLATFSGTTRFEAASFSGNAWFGGVSFGGDARFGGASFGGDAWFGGATFSSTTRFGGATFSGNAWFGGATLPGTHYVDDSTPSPWTDFSAARFERGVPAEVARFVEAPVRAQLKWAGLTEGADRGPVAQSM